MSHQPPPGGPAGEPGTGAEALDAHRRAMTNNDEIVQLLATAKYALIAGDPPRALAAIDAALGLSRHTLTDLLTLAGPGAMTTYAGRLPGSADAPQPPGAPGG